MDKSATVCMLRSVLEMHMVMRGADATRAKVAEIFSTHSSSEGLHADTKSVVVGGDGTHCSGSGGEEANNNNIWKRHTGKWADLSSDEE